MDITLKREHLFPEVQHLQTIVERKTTVPILGHILLETLGNNLVLTATDLDVSLRSRCEAQVRVGGALTISARKLFEIVRLAPPGSIIHIKSVAEGDWVEIGYDRSRFKVAALARSNFPEIGEAEGQLIRMDATTVRRMIGSCVFAITQEESRYTLSGALAVITPSDLSLVTTDGHRLVVVQRDVGMDIDQEEIRVLIPKKALVELVKLLGEADGDIEFRSGERRISFGIGSRLLISRILSGEFPNYKMVIPQGNSLVAHLNTLGFTGALRRVAVVSDQDAPAVEVSLSEGLVKLACQNSNGERAAEAMETTYDGPPVVIGFNVNYLLDFVNVVETEQVLISLKDSDTQGLLQPVSAPDAADSEPAGGYKMQYVIMPLSL